MCHCLIDRTKLINVLLLVALFVFIGHIVDGQSEEKESRCLKAVNCDECMRIGSECHWCEDGNFTLGGRLNRPRCDEISVLEKDNICQNIRYLNDTKHEINDNAPFDSVIQVRPQKLTLALRAGNAKKFKVNIKPAENFPVDIYFLNDLSFSMKEDLENLRKLSNKIAQEIGSITKNYRLGFGAFIDKPTQPFIFYPEDFPEFPCTRKETEEGICKFKRPIFGYSHIFDFSSNTTAFQEAVEKIDVSADIDDAEGCFDGLMQAVVCESVLKWKQRGRARRLIIMATDAEPKLAGDAKLANILKPNDGKCYLQQRSVNGKSEMYYYKTLDMDYPSISQLRRVMKEAGVAPILAVSAPFIDQYKKIAEHWEELGSAAEILSEDSTNIVEVVRDNYKRIATTVALTDEAPPYLEITYKVDKTTCTTPARVVSDSVCADVKLNKEIVFDVEIKLKECPNPLPKDPSVKIRIAGFGEVSVDIEYLCECNCEKEPLSPKCNFKGTYKCGICECTEGFFGSFCQCDAAKVSRNDTSKCIDPQNQKQICSGEGQCICGKCECAPKQSPKVISGDYCECKNYGCPKYLGSECGSAETPDSRGECKCGKCLCVPPYKGINCGEIECVVQQKLTCKKGGIECSGHGKCSENCKDCKCDPGYAGENCEKCITQDCKCATIDPSCLKCHVTNSTCAEELKCDQHTFIVSENSTFPISCGVKYDDLCTATYNFTQEYLHNTSMVWEYVTSCTTFAPAGDDTDTLAIILGIIAGILLLGLLLLLLWKLLVTLHDKKEYAKFEKAQNDSHWEKDGNPIYREPNQQFVNPAYAGES